MSLFAWHITKIISIFGDSLILKYSPNTQQLSYFNCWPFELWACHKGHSHYQPLAILHGTILIKSITESVGLQYLESWQIQKQHAGEFGQNQMQDQGKNTRQRYLCQTIASLAMQHILYPVFRSEEKGVVETLIFASVWDLEFMTTRIVCLFVQQLILPNSWIDRDENLTKASLGLLQY